MGKAPCGDKAAGSGLLYNGYYFLRLQLPVSM